MAQYLITYDNHAPRDYTKLYQLMASWRAVRLAESVWLANLKGPASAIRNFVAGCLQNNDTVAVLELKQGSEWATANVSTAANTWLSNNILPIQKAA